MRFLDIELDASSEHGQSAQPSLLGIYVQRQDTFQN